MFQLSSQSSLVLVAVVAIVVAIVVVVAVAVAVAVAVVPVAVVVARQVPCNWMFGCCFLLRGGMVAAVCKLYMRVMMAIASLLL